MQAIIEAIEGLIKRFFGGSAMAVIRSVFAKVLEAMASIFKRVAPAR